MTDYLAGLIIGGALVFLMTQLVPRLLGPRKEKPPADRVLLLSGSGLEGVLAEARQIEGLWFASRVGGRFEEALACVLNHDGTTTGGSYVQKWLRVTGMDGFGPSVERRA